MDEKFDEYNLLRSGYFCDCCGTTHDVLYTLEGSCPITLCAECIKQFHVLSTKKKAGLMIKLFKRETR